MNLELHPLSTLFPRMTDAEFAALVADIRAHGLRDAIVTYQGMVLDGGHRQKACAIAEVQPRYLEFSGNDPVAFVFSKNLRRRHLSPGQEAAIVALATDWTTAQGVGKPKSGNDAGLESGSVAGLSRVQDRASLSGASDRTQRMADKVAKADPELAKQVAQGTVSLPEAVAMVEGKTSVATKRDKPTSGPVSTPEPAEDEGPGAAELLDEMQADLRKAEARVAELEAALTADGKEAVVKLSQRLEQAERTRDDAMESAAKLKQARDFYERQLARCGKAVGQRDLDKIAPAVEAFARAHSKVAA